MKIVLIGYMASGKSLIGKKLSTVLNYNFIDLDDYIEKKQNKTISQIFSKKGEIYFRKTESKSLKEILDKEGDMVLSLGGGTPCYSNNMEVILNSNKVVSVYLNVTITEIFNRLKTEENKRPLISHLKNDEDLLEFIGKHLFERSNFYRQANLLVDANSNPDKIIEDIILKLF